MINTQFNSKERKIHYIPGNEGAVNLLQKYLHFQNYQFEEYDLGKIDKNTLYLILVEPCKIGTQYFTINKIWKRFLQGNGYSTKLIVASYSNCEHSNHLDLLNLPANLEKWLEGIRKVDDFKIDRLIIDDEEILNDTWECNGNCQTRWNQRGYTMESRLQRFFDGHRERSLAKYLIGIRQTMNMARDEIEATDEEAYTYQEVLDKIVIKFGKKEWEQLDERRRHYFPLFRYLPFQPTLEKIENLMEEIRPFFENGFPYTQEEFLQAKLPQKFNQIYDMLIGEIEPYSKLETYYNKKYPQNERA